MIIHRMNMLSSLILKLIDQQINTLILYSEDEYNTQFGQTIPLSEGSFLN